MPGKHRQWFSSFAPEHGTNWEGVFRNDPEAALSEAGVRRYLVGIGVSVEPGEDVASNGGGPDFRCFNLGHEFFVEVTSLSMQRVEDITGSNADGKARRFIPMNPAISMKCVRKASQCSKRHAPVLLAVCTFSGTAMTAFSPPYPENLLTGIVHWVVAIAKKGEDPPIQKQQSNLESAPFLEFNKQGQVEPAHTSVSGLLLCGLTFKPEMVTGVLNPLAVYPFDPKCLPSIHFDTADVNLLKGEIRLNPTGDCEN